MTSPLVVERVWQPNPRQSLVLDFLADSPEGSTNLLGFGGAAGGAKTNLLAALARKISLACPGARTLIGRQDFVDLRTTTLNEFDLTCPPEIVSKRYDSAPVFRDIRLPSWPDGTYSRVYFRSLDDWQSLLSEEYGYVLIDEAQEVSLAAVMGLLTRLRHRPEKTWGLVACFNPFPGWCTNWFIKRKGLPLKLHDDPNVRVHFVRSLMSDNPHLRAGYKEMLDATLDPYMHAVMVEGKDDVVPNAVYPQLDVEKHLIPRPVHLRQVGGAIGVDWGEKHNSAVLAVSRMDDGTYWVRECWAAPGGDPAKIEDVSRGLKVRYGIRRGRTDPLQDVLAHNLGFSVADKGQETRKKRISNVTKLLNADALFFDLGGAGVPEAFEEAQLYRWEETESETKSEWVIVRKNEDRVAALEYAIEEMSQPSLTFGRQATDSPQQRQAVGPKGWRRV